MKHARQIQDANLGGEAEPVSAALDLIEHLIEQLGPDAGSDDASLALWEPTRALGAALDRA